jgi:hypothetical protein
MNRDRSVVLASARASRALFGALAEKLFGTISPFLTEKLTIARARSAAREGACAPRIAAVRPTRL